MTEPAELILADMGARNLVSERDERDERLPSMLRRLELALERFGDRRVLLVLQPQEPGPTAELASELYDALVAEEQDGDR